MKRFKRGFSIVEVVISMAMILIISLSAYFACIACATVISNAKNSAKIITNSQTLINLFKVSFKDETVSDFKNCITTNFANQSNITHYGALNQEQGVCYSLDFNYGNIDFYIVKSNSGYNVLVKSFTNISQNPVFEYQELYN